MSDHPAADQIFHEIFRQPPTLSDQYTHFFAVRAEGAPHTRPFIPGKTVLPRHDTLEWLSTAVEHVALSGQHLYYRPCLRNAQGALLGSWCVWVDIDLRSTPDGATLLEKYEPKPTFAYWSGGGYHAVWVLNEFCEDVPLIEAVNMALCDRLGGDRKAGRAAMGLRVPGTINWKYYRTANPEVYTCSPVRFATGRRVSLGDMPVSTIAYKKRAIGHPSNFREMYLRYFPDHPNPDSDQWSVRCPFHDDQTASLSISMEHGSYMCHAAGCGVKGSAISFMARQEGLPWREVRKILDHLKVRASIIDTIEHHLRSACTPLYRDSAHVIVRTTSGRYTRYYTGSRSQIIASIQGILDGSPAMQITNAIGDDVDTENLNKLIIEAALQLGQNLPERETMTFLGDGIHYTGDHILRTSGGILGRWGTDAWEEIDTIPFDGVYLPYYVGDPPKPWHSTARPLRDSNPPTTFAALVAALNCWHWERPMDPILMAAYTIYLPHWQMFGTPIHAQISGQTVSGKSSLVEGWLTGNTPESVQMVPGALYMTNVTAAHLYQTLDHATTPVVLDEVVDHHNRRTQDVLELIRNMESGGSPVRRGTKDGRGTQHEVMVPTICSSIRIPDMIQDINRRMHFSMPKINPPPPNPWQLILDMWSRTQVANLAVMASEIVPRNATALAAIQRRITADLRQVTGGAYRMATRMVPLLAIACLCGQDTDTLIADVLDRVHEVEAQTMEASPTETLRNALLFRPFRIPGFEGETTLAREIDLGGSADLIAPNVGLCLWRSTMEVGVIASRFIPDTSERTSPQNTVRFLRDISGYIGSCARRVSGAQIRMTLFNAHRLLSGDEGPRNANTAQPVLKQNGMDTMAIEKPR